MHYFLQAALLFMVAVAYKIAINSWCLRRLRALQVEHAEYVRALAKAPGAQSWAFVKKGSELAALMKKAGVPDQTVTRLEPVGYGHVKSMVASMFDNFGANSVDIQSSVIMAFHRAEGVFETRRREAASPFYWSETLIYLPENILAYVGLPKSSIWAKAANALGWVIAVVGFLTSLPDFSDLQKSVSHHLAQAAKFLHF